MRPAINWDNIERLMLKSFTGGDLNDRDQELVRQAWEADANEYARRHRRVKDDEIERLRSL
jgi:hypothetical protein